MKSVRTLALLMGLFATLVIVSCKKNDALAANAGEANARTASASIVENSIPLSDLPDCNSHCIDPNGPYVQLTGSQTHYYGNSGDPHSKTVSYTAYNTATSFVVEVRFVHSGGNSSNLVRVTALGSPQSVATLASGATATFTFALPEGWSACTNVPFAIRQEGQSAPMDISASYNLYGICVADDRCETSFTGEAISCGTTDREAVFTFKSKDAHDYIKIQGGLTNFTGVNATVYINGTVVDFNTTSADGWAQGTVNGYTVGQRTPGGGSNRNIRVEGGLTECDELVIRIVWDSSNAGGVITGSWSVKDANGVELATAVAGLTCD